MSRLIFIYILLAVSTSIYAQNEDRNWCFHDSNRLSFEIGSQLSNLNTDIRIERYYENAKWNYPNSISVSDSNGNLIFYSDGTRVWNKDNQIMPGGSNIKRSNNLTPHFYVIKKPNSNQYYLIEKEKENNFSSFFKIDMDSSSGYGKVIEIDSLHFGSFPLVNHPSSKFVWFVNYHGIEMIFNKFSSKGEIQFSHNINFLSFDLGPLEFYNYSRLVWISNDNQKMIVSMRSKSEFDTSEVGIITMRPNTGLPFLVVFDFDIEFGLISNPKKIKINPKNINYQFDNNNNFSSLAFSHSSKYFYTSFSGWDYENLVGLYQCPANLDKDTLLEKYCVKISDSVNIGDWNHYHMSDMKRAPNSKIYLTRLNSTQTDANVNNKDSSISIIYYPDSFGNTCNYREFDLKLNSRSPRLFPRFLPSLYFPQIQSKGVCVDEPVKLWLEYAQYDSVFWEFGDGNNKMSNKDTILHTFKQEGEYAVFVKLYQGGTVSDTSSLILSIHALPQLELINDTLLCEGSTINLNVFDSSIVNYYWSNNSTTASILVSEEGKYWVNVKTDYCSNSDSIFVGFVNCNISTKNVCQGDSAFMELLETEIDSVIWDFGDNSSLKTNLNHIAHMYADSGVYLVKAQLFYKGLSLVLEKNIEVYFVPNDVKLISNPSEGCINLPVNFELQTNYPYKYDFIILFGNGDSTSTIENRPNYNYTYSKEGSFVPILRFRTSNGCFVEVQSDTIKTWGKPKASFTYNPSQPSLDSSQIHFNNQSTGAEFYYWEIQPFGHFEVFEPKVNYTDTGTFAVSLIAENNKGCRDTFISYLIVLPNYRVYLPSAFSPNGDDLNDNFRPIVSGVAEMSFQVFNRWGQMVFMGKDNDTWDGTFNGKPVPEGIYVYNVQVLNMLGEKQRFSGSLTVLR